MISKKSTACSKNIGMYILRSKKNMRTAVSKNNGMYSIKKEINGGNLVISISNSLF